MADTKISDLVELAEAPALEDMLALVDDSDTSMAASGTTKRITGANLLAPVPVTNATQAPYKANRSGGAGAVAAIQGAIDDRADAGGGVVFLDWGTYDIADSPGLQLRDGVQLRGAGMGATTLTVGIDLPATSTVAGNNAVIGTTGADYPTGLSDNVAATLSASPAVGDSALTVDSTASLSANSYYMLGSDDRAFPGSTIRHGEIVRVDSVDSGTALTLFAPVRGIYTTGNGAKLYTITFIDGVGVSDLTIHNPDFDAGTTRFINLTGCRDFEIDRVLMTDGDVTGVSCSFCLDGRISIIGRNFNDNNAASRNGYGVSLNGLNENIDVNINVRKARHGFTNGVTAAIPGLQRGITVSGVCSEATVAAFDSHGGGEGLVFRNAHAHNCPNSGFQIRSVNTMMVACTTNHCGTSVTGVGSGVLGLTDDLNVVGCIFRKATNQSGSDGLHVSMPDGTERVCFNGCTFDGAFRNTVTLGGTDVRFINCAFANPGQSASAQTHISVGGTAVDAYIDDCVFVNFTTGTNDTQSSGTASAHAISVASGATGTFIGRGNRIIGFTTMVSDSGTGTILEYLTNAYTPTNVSTDRSFDANSTSINELADVLGTLIADLQTLNYLP